MRASSWTDRAEYAVGRSLEALVSHLPESLAERAGAGLGTLVRAPLGIRRVTVEANLRRAFPEAPEEWIARVARGVFRHLGRESAAILRLSRITPEAIVERTETVGWAALEEALGEGRGAILYTGHFGNWEVAAASVAARGLPMAAVVKRMRNRQVDARLDAIRHRLGVETIDQEDAPRRVPRWLRAGGLVGIVADQDARRAGIWIPFFGHPASTHRGPALFALRLGAPIFAGFATRLPGQRARYRVHLERVPAVRTGELEADVTHLTAALTERLEAAVRADPEQYFWFHKRWKTAPPAEPQPEWGGTTTPGFGANVPGKD